jgi:hypothetical protein
VADINERLDRLQRREDFDRFGRPLRHAPADTPVGPPLARPAGVDDRLGEVLDAVASVVRRHPGLSVMVALADGRAGRPVIRVTERDGDVETGVVVVGSGPPRVVEPGSPLAEPRQPAAFGPYDGLSSPAAAPARESVPGSDPVFEPALRDSPRDAVASLDGALGRDGSLARGDLGSLEGVLGRDGSLARGDLGSLEGVLGRDGSLAREELAAREGPAGRDGGREVPSGPDGDGVRDDLQPGRGPARSAAANGRHAAARESQGRTGSSWHDALWSPESRDRFRQAGQDRQQDRQQDRHQDREEHGGAAGAIPLAEDTSQVVSRLAQLLRDNPTLAANWSREAQE